MHGPQITAIGKVVISVLLATMCLGSDKFYLSDKKKRTLYYIHNTPLPQQFYDM